MINNKNCISKVFGFCIFVSNLILLGSEIYISKFLPQPHGNCWIELVPLYIMLKSLKGKVKGKNTGSGAKKKSPTSNSSSKSIENNREYKIVCVPLLLFSNDL